MWQQNQRGKTGRDRARFGTQSQIRDTEISKDG